MYEVEKGIFYPSITSILSMNKPESIKRWQKRVGKTEADIAMQRGSRRGNILHKSIEQYLIEGTVPDFKIPSERMTFEQVKKFVDYYIKKVVAIEKPIFSHELKCAGTADLISILKTREDPFIVDFKTANDERKKEDIENYFLQTTAYAIMYEERYGIKVPYIAVVIAIDLSNKPQIFLANRSKYEEKLKSVIRRFYDEQNF